jgi:hypothetical protein
MTRLQLVKLARQRGIKGASKMRVDELKYHLSDNGVLPQIPEEDTVVEDETPRPPEITIRLNTPMFRHRPVLMAFAELVIALKEAEELGIIET